MAQVGEVAVMPLPLGGYGAYQVSEIDDGDRMTVCVLDRYPGVASALADLAPAGPLLLTHHNWPGKPLAVTVDRSVPPPPELVWLGRMPVHPGMPRGIDDHGDWEDLSFQVAHQHRWDLRIPSGVRAAYKDAARETVPFDLGDGPRTACATTSHLDLPAHPARIRWAALDALPRLTALGHSGADRGLAGALAGHPLVEDLTWHDPPDGADLSATHLTRLGFSGGSPRHLRLPPGLMELRLTSGWPEAVEADGDGRWIDLIMTAPFPALPPGLHGVRHLDLEVAGDLSLSVLASLTRLESLRLRWKRPHGRLLDASDTSRFPRLRTLCLIDAYGVDASALPSPATSPPHLSVDGMRREQAALLKARYRGTPVRVNVRGAKSDAWLAANVDNPLRDWADDDERAGAAACEAYAAAFRAVGRLPAALTGARPILRDLVERLNRIDERYGIVDTIRREQAADAFIGLADRAGVPDAEAAGWFDEWRDF